MPKNRGRREKLGKRTRKLHEENRGRKFLQTDDRTHGVQATHFAAPPLGVELHTYRSKTGPLIDLVWEPACDKIVYYRKDGSRIEYTRWGVT